MYVRTPKRYRRTARRSVFPVRRILGTLLMIVVIVVGIGIYQNRSMFQPEVARIASTAIAGIERSAATIAAPTPTPTQDPTARLVQANNFWQTGSVNEALNLYMPILPSVPNDLAVHYRVTLGLITQGDVEQALDYAEQTVTADPFSADAWAIRAWALDWNGRPNEAIASALHARELDPENPRALAYLGEAYFGAGQTERALNTVNQALELDPDSLEAYRARGFIRAYGQFDFGGGLSDLQRAYDLALAQNPAASTLIAIDLAQIELRNQNIEGAIAILENVLELNPENTLALFWLGSVYFGQLGDPSQARGYLLRCVDYNPESINCNYLLGRTQERLDELTAASESFARAIELGSNSARHFWWAGRTQISLGNCGQALTYLREGYELALRGSDTQLVEDYEAILPLCNADFGQRSAPTPDPEATQEAGPGDL